MKFFTREQKELALKVNRGFLSSEYIRTEEALHIAACIGDERRLSEAMAAHQRVEYAMLYQLTPEYMKLKKSTAKTVKNI